MGCSELDRQIKQKMTPQSAMLESSPNPLRILDSLVLCWSSRFRASHLEPTAPVAPHAARRERPW